MDAGVTVQLLQYGDMVVTIAQNGCLLIDV